MSSRTLRTSWIFAPHSPLTKESIFSDAPLLIHKSNLNLLESLSVRTANVKTFLSLLNPRLELDLVPLNDVLGPTGTEEDIQGLVVSRESVAGGEASECCFPQRLGIGGVG